jgi:WD40 repeat protein
VTPSINTLAFSPTGLYLASGADDNTVIIWNISDGQFIFRLKFDSPVHVAIWHPNRSETLILGCRDGSLLEASNFRLVTGANLIYLNLH